MEVFKAMAFIGESPHPQYLDVVSLSRSWWIVCTWTTDKTTGTRIPARLLQMGGLALRFQEVSGLPYRFLVSNPIPKSVLDGGTQDGYVVAVAAHIPRPFSSH